MTRVAIITGASQGLGRALAREMARRHFALVIDARRPDRLAEAERELGGSGRVLLRPSGTEQLVRVMVEAATAEQAKATAVRIAEVVAAAR